MRCFYFRAFSIHQSSAHIATCSQKPSSTHGPLRSTDTLIRQTENCHALSRIYNASRPLRFRSCSATYVAESIVPAQSSIYNARLLPFAVPNPLLPGADDHRAHRVLPALVDRILSGHQPSLTPPSYPNRNSLGRHQTTQVS